MEAFGRFKKFEVKDAEFKYGFKQQGIFALESIKKGKFKVTSWIRPELMISIDTQKLHRVNIPNNTFVPWSTQV